MPLRTRSINNEMIFGNFENIDHDVDRIEKPIRAVKTAKRIVFRMYASLWFMT